MLNGKISEGTGSGSSSLLSVDEACYAAWIDAYKTYGENSYVYIRKDIWKTLLESPVAINDLGTSTLALNWALEQGGHAGKVIGSIYGIGDDDWESCPTLEDIINNLSVCEKALTNKMSSELTFKYLINHKSLQELDTDDYIPLLVNSFYGQSIKTTATSYNKPSLVLTGVSDISEGKKTGGNFYVMAYAQSGLYVTLLDGTQITYDRGKGTGEYVVTGENGYTSGSGHQPYTKNSYTINRVVNSLPVISKYHYYSYDGGTNYAPSTTAYAKYTYIPL